MQAPYTGGVEISPESKQSSTVLNRAGNGQELFAATIPLKDALDVHGRPSNATDGGHLLGENVKVLSMPALRAAQGQNLRSRLLDEAPCPQGEHPWQREAAGIVIRPQLPLLLEPPPQQVPPLQTQHATFS